MSHDDSSAPSDLAAQADALLDLINGYTKAANDDELVVLDGMQEEVARFCLGVQDLPPEEARAYAPVLEALGESIDALREALEAAQVRVKEKLEGLGSVQKAHTAYRTVSGAPPVKHPSEPEE